MNFTVKRGDWLRGEGGGSFLRRKTDGKMCCLGFLALACGATEEEITGVRVPSQVRLNWPALIVKAGNDDAPVFEETGECKTIMNINDSWPATERETALIERFADLGITLTFKD